MSELARELQRLTSELEWPATPALPVLELPGRRERPWLRPALVAVAALIVALAAALSVPAARSGLLRLFHLGSVTVERVQVLPPAQAVPLGAEIGPRVTPEAARAALGAPVRLPPLKEPAPLHLRSGVVSVLLAAPEPLLLSEFRYGQFLLKKIAGLATDVAYVRIGPAPGLWIAGAEHVAVLPAAPPRLAGNVLVWQVGPITYRLEGRLLSRKLALEIASSVTGT